MPQADISFLSVDSECKNRQLFFQSLLSRNCHCAQKRSTWLTDLSDDTGTAMEYLPNWCIETPHCKCVYDGRSNCGLSDELTMLACLRVEV